MLKELSVLDFSKVFIIAELSANHNGSLETAKETIRAAPARFAARIVSLAVSKPQW